MTNISVPVSTAFQIYKIDGNDLKYLNPNGDENIDFDEFKSFVKAKGANRYKSLFDFFDKGSEGKLSQEVKRGAESKPDKQKNNNIFKFQNFDASKSSFFNTDKQKHDNNSNMNAGLMNFEQNDAKFAQNQMGSEQNPYKYKKLDLVM